MWLDEFVSVARAETNDNVFTPPRFFFSFLLLLKQLQQQTVWCSWSVDPSSLTNFFLPVDLHLLLRAIRLNQVEYQQPLTVYSKYSLLSLSLSPFLSISKCVNTSSLPHHLTPFTNFFSISARVKSVTNQTKIKLFFFSLFLLMIARTHCESK